MPKEISKSKLSRAVAVFESYGATEVYLFGSQASKTARADSDVDLAVAGLPPAFFFRALGEAWDILERPIDLVDLDADGPFTRHLKTRGVLSRVF